MAEYISKEAVLKHLNECKEDPLFDPDMARICFAISIFIENMQATDVQPVKHGYWINHRINDEKSLLHGAIKDTTCSECKKSTPYKTNYCMHCGARMDGDAE